MSNPAPTLNQINAFNVTQGTTIDFNIIGGTEVIRSNKIYIYDLSDNSLICTHLYVSTESIHELPPNTSSSIVYASGKSSADFTNNTQYYAQIQTFTDTSGTQGASGLSIAKLFWCLPTPTLTLSTIPTTISTTSYNVSATYTPNTFGSATNEIQEFQFNLYSAIGVLLQTSGVVLYGEGVDLSYNFSGLEVDSTYYVTLDVTTTQGMNMSAQSNTFTVSIDTPTIGSASVVNNGCDGYISVTSSLSSEYEHEESSSGGEIMSFTTDSVNDIIELDVDFEPVQDGTPWMSAQDTEPYMFRAVPTQTEDFGYESDCIVGGTVGWNQKLDKSKYVASTTFNGITYTNNGDGSWTVQGTATGGDSSLDLLSPTPSIPVTGHKEMLWTGVTSGSWGKYVVYDYNNNVAGGFVNAWQKGGAIGVAGNAYRRIRILIWEGVTVDFKTTPMLIDLTQLFGSTIADYVYTLESGTAGAGVAWLKKYAPQLFEYNEYDAGSLVSVNGLTSHDMVGFNQWDEEWEQGSINANTGQNTSGNTIRSKNYIPVVPSQNYYCNVQVLGIWYDADKNYIGYVSNGSALNVMQAPTNGYYFRFRTDISYGTTYKNDICINLSDASLNGTYKPHVKHSYPLDSDLILRGIPKLDASNNLYYDGDIYESDGTVTRRFVEVTLNQSNTWSVENSGMRIKTSDLASVIKHNSSNSTLVGAICDKFLERTPNQTWAGGASGIGFSIAPNGDVGFCQTGEQNMGYSAWVTFVTNNPITLVCELATPTTSYADPYTNPQIVDPHGTEQYVGSSIPVGHETTYQRICPISGWDSVELEYAGKNVLALPIYYRATTDVPQLFKIKKGEYYISFNVKNATSWRIGTWMKDKDGNNLSDGSYCPNMFLSWYANPGYWLQGGNGTSKGFEVHIEEDCYIRFFIFLGDTTEQTEVVDAQLELGSTATPYTPYNGQTYTSTFPKYKQQVTQDKIPYITKDIGDTYADTLTENLVGGTIAWNQSVPDTTTTHTVSGSIASMNDAVAGNFESVVCDIEPHQDLHGYDKPWVGGAGKNLFSVDLITSLSNLSRNGETFTNTSADSRDYFSFFVQAYSDSTYIKQQGGAVSGTGRKSVTIDLPSGITSLRIKHSGSSNDMTIVYPFTREGTFTVSLDVVSGNPSTVGGLEFKNVQIESGSTATSYAPYENICPITGWTGCEVDVAGVNVWNEETAIILSRIRSNTYIPVLPNTTYYFKCPSGTYADIGEYSIKSISSLIQYQYKGGSSNPESNKFTTSANTHYILFTMNTAYGTTYNNDISVNYPSTDTSYHAYNGTTYPITWQTEAGTVYGGYLDVVSGVLTVTHGDITLDGTQNISITNWRPTSNGVGWVYPYSVTNAIVPTSDATVTDTKCDALQTVGYGSLFGGEIGCAILANSAGVSSYGLCVRLPDTSLTTSTAINNYLQSNPIHVCYELATPQTYQLTGQQIACLLGRNNVWADTGNTTVTYPTNHSYQSLSTTHKYYKRINGVESISVGSDVVADVGTDNIIDLTQMFGTTIADYIYNREQSSSSNMGVKFFKSLFPNDDYDYNSGELISVKASAHVIKDANGNVVHTYPLDSDLVLRGIPKLDANNKLYYDGDVYEPDGSVTRKWSTETIFDGSSDENWGLNATTADYTIFVITVSDTVSVTNTDTEQRCVAYPFTGVPAKNAASAAYHIAVISNHRFYVTMPTSVTPTEASFKTWLANNPLTVVYEKDTPTTESADPFEENQTIIPNGIEEYTVTEQGDVEMPVGHDSTYYATPIYGGTIDMVSGVLTINMASVGLGTLTWVKNGTRMLSQNLSPVAKNIDTSTIPNAICSQYVPKKWGEVASGGYDGAFCVTSNQILVMDSNYTDAEAFTQAMNGVQLVYELATPIEISLTPQQMQTLSGQNNVWSNTNGGMFLVYQLPITALLVKRRDVADVSGKWLTLYSTPITQADDMDFTFIDFLNQYGKTYQYALVPVLEQNQSGVIVQIEGGYTVSDNVDSIFDGVYIADQTNVERVKAGAGYGNIDMNQGVGSITPIGSKYPIVITNSQNQYHNGSIRGTIVPNDFYSNGNLSRIDMVNKRDELEQFLTNKRAKIIKDWNGKIWLVMIMSNVSCSFDDNYGMGMVSFSADWLEVGDPTNQQDLYNAGLINVGGV